MFPLGYCQVMVSTKALGRRILPLILYVFFWPLLDSAPVHFKILLCHHLTPSRTFFADPWRVLISDYNECNLYSLLHLSVCHPLFESGSYFIVQEGPELVGLPPVPLTDVTTGECHHIWLSCKSDSRNSWCFILPLGFLFNKYVAL